MPGVAITESEQVIPQTDICDIVLPECLQKLLSLNIKSLRLIEDVGFQEGVHIGLYGVGAWRVLPCPSIQEAFIDQSVADRVCRDSAANIIGDKR